MPKCKNKHIGYIYGVYDNYFIVRLDDDPDAFYEVNIDKALKVGLINKREDLIDGLNIHRFDDKIEFCNAVWTQKELDNIWKYAKKSANKYKRFLKD